jgi:hypothetical protein
MRVVNALMSCEFVTEHGPFTILTPVPETILAQVFVLLR